MYQQIYKKLISPIHENIFKRSKFLNYLGFLEESQWWPRDKLLNFQWKELQKLLKHSYEQVPYWCDVFKKLKIKPDDIKNYSDFQKLPIIEKQDIRRNKKLMVARNYAGKTFTKSTSGSTGMPLELDYTSDSYDWRMAVSKRGYSWAGCEDGKKQAYFWGGVSGKESIIKKCKEYLYHMVLRQKYIDCCGFTEKNMGVVLENLNQYAPEVIIGYANPIYNFSRFVERHGNLRFKPKAIISAAEKLYKPQREVIANAFKCQVFNTYGSREFMLIASECAEHKGLHINVENLFVEVINESGFQAKPGEMGDVIITDLHNYGMPFIRYRIGDMAIPTDEKCACGRELPLLEDVTGRTLDIIRTPDGRYIPGEFFTRLFREFNEIRQFQVVQDKLDSLNLKIIREKQISDKRIDFIKDEVGKILGKKVSVKIEFVDNIPLTKTGKYRVTVSNIPG
ncbi:MAG: phenylacetate--CoA ligase family protein [Candidatus Omnitrophota bacterium]